MSREFGRKFLLITTTTIFGISSCYPVDIIASNPTPTSVPPPTETTEPDFRVYEGDGPIPQFPEYSRDVIQLSVVACNEKKEPDHDCNDPEDVPIRGISVGVKFERADGGREFRRITTDESGFTTISETRNDNDGFTSLVFPPENLIFVGKDGKIVRVCRGIPTWELGENQKLTFPYAEKNCGKPQYDFQNAQKKGSKFVHNPARVQSSQLQLKGHITNSKRRSKPWTGKF